jgi:MerR family transcriptional regulator, light-induced transcriptional regulator
MAIAEGNLSVAAVARLLGLAPSTLRTWDRRYGLGASGHEAGSHRRYSPTDVAKLMMMRRLIATGVAPNEAAEIAISHKGLLKIEKINYEHESRDELVKALYKAACNFDKVFIESEIYKDLAQYGVDSTWSQVMTPLLILVGNHWEETGEGVDVEHLLTEVLIRILRDCVKEVKQPLNSRPVLLAAVGAELHSLPLHALAAALAERRIETHFLGSLTPLDAIAAMVKKSAPPAVFLWAQLQENALPEFFRELPVVRPAPRIVLGGPGWDRKECSDVAIVEDITQACLEIERAVGL